MLLRSSLLAAVIAAVAATPAFAQRQLVTPLKPCYVAAQEEQTEPVLVDAMGFSPTTFVDFYVDDVLQDVTPDSDEDVRTTFDGKLYGTVPAPFVEEGERLFTLRVTERNTQNSLVATSRITRLMVEQRPAVASTRDRVTFRGRGFTDLTKPVYAHYVFAGKSQRNVRLGVPAGECGTFSIKRQQFPFKKSPRRGTWTIQFDQSRTYDAKTPVRFTLQVRVRKAIKPEPARAR